MKKLMALILAGAMVLACAGCSGDSGSGGGASSSAAVDSSAVSDGGASKPAGADSSEGTSTSEPEEVDYSKLTDEEIYQLMVKNSLMTTGDTARMANVLKKAQNGEEITVAYIGGSITYGMTVAPNEPEKCWAYLSYKWLCDKFPDTKINFVNAGISGTPSILGNARLERDVLDFDPDIVFVEFAVNDGTETTYKNGYECLVRTLLEQDKDIAVVLFFTIIKSGHTCQEHMSQIGNNYHLPMISEPNSLWVEMEQGRMTWEDYSDDESHPNEYGHKVVCDFITYYFEQVLADLDNNTGDVSKELPAPLFSDRYAHTHFIDGDDVEIVDISGFKRENTQQYFPNGWMYKGKDGASMTIKLTCKSLQVVFKANNNKVYGTADVYVDGVKTGSVVSNTPGGWGEAEAVVVFDEDEVAEHTIELRVEGGDTCYFSVLGFGYCD